MEEGRTMILMYEAPGLGAFFILLQGRAELSAIFVLLLSVSFHGGLNSGRINDR